MARSKIVSLVDQSQRWRRLVHVSVEREKIERGRTEGGEQEGDERDEMLRVWFSFFAFLRDHLTRR